MSTIAGRISNPDGTPHPGAPVFAAIERPGGSRRIAAQTVSEWDGRYQLSGVPPGQYVVGARWSQGKEVTLYPGLPDAPPRRHVTVLDRVPTEGIDIWLQPHPQRYTVSGRIFWPEGRKVENIAIEYNTLGDPRRGVWYVFDPGGLFGIEAVSDGTMIMLVRADSDRGPLIGMAATDVAGPVDDVRVTLEPPGSVAGRIVGERAWPGGQMPSRVTLHHTLLRTTPLYPIEAGEVDREGRFRIPDVRGEYAFSIDGLPGGWRLKRLRRAGRAVPSGRVTVGPGETLTGLELVVGP